MSVSRSFILYKPTLFVITFHEAPPHPLCSP
nr:MAG TPA: hypothetical protein [Caudoviricetes sp.]